MNLCKGIHVVELPVKKNINKTDTPSMTGDESILKELLTQYGINTALYFRYVSDGKGLTLTGSPLK